MNNSTPDRDPDFCHQIGEPNSPRLWECRESGLYQGIISHYSSTADPAVHPVNPHLSRSAATVVSCQNEERGHSSGTSIQISDVSNSFNSTATNTRTDCVLATPNTRDCECNQDICNTNVTQQRYAPSPAWRDQPPSYDAAISSQPVSVNPSHAFSPTRIAQLPSGNYVVFAQPINSSRFQPFGHIHRTRRPNQTAAFPQSENVPLLPRNLISIPDYLCLSIFAMVVCFPIGAINIVRSLQVRELIKEGKLYEADFLSARICYSNFHVIFIGVCLIIGTIVVLVTTLT